MPDEAQLAGAFLLSFLVVWALVPVAIGVAERTDFYDHPASGYKSHATPTPYLGGAAVTGGFLVSLLVFAGDLSPFFGIAGCVMMLSVVGTLDDRFGVQPIHRLALEAVAGAALWSLGVRWGLGSEPVDFLLTVLCVLALANALNILDNMDGVAGTLASVCAAGIAVAALLAGDVAVAAGALALCGACLAFLRYNLSTPARIFLGDGGSVPIGFGLAALTMSVAPGDRFGWPGVLAAGLLVGVPVLDTLLVTVSRIRHRVPLATPGPDSVTYRLRRRLGSPRRVALAIGTVQAGLSLLANAVIELGRGATIAAGVASLLLGAIVVAVLETPAWSLRAPRKHVEA